MAEIEIILPTVQYGNVKIRATPEEWGTLLDSPHSIGTMTAVFLNLFTQGFKEGATMDVAVAPRGSNAIPEEQAKALLNAALGGVTEVSDPQEDGGLNYHPNDGPEESDDAPWNQKVDAKPKPWETGTSTPDKLVAGLGDGW